LAKAASAHWPWMAGVPMISANASYLPRLDHLRFIAAAIVLTFHFGYANLVAANNPFLLILREGYSGVSLFMVISGFILTHICLENEVDYKKFIINRIIRIYPLYILVVFIAIYAAGRQVHFLSFSALFFFMGNLNSVAFPKYPHIWTIMVEFQFYLVFPFLIMFVNRYGAKYLLGLIACLILVRLQLLLEDGSVQDAAYWTIIGRMDQFAVGMLAAVVFRKYPSLFASAVFLPLALAGVFAWAFILDWWCGGYYGTGSPRSPSYAWVFGPTLEALAFAFFLLAYMSVRITGTFSHALFYPSKIFAFLGTISYSIYIWHFPIVQFVNRSARYFDEWYLNLLLVAFPLVVIASVLSFYVIERPFLLMRSNYIKKKPA
jgi:peptidoglycan/LPS O-acetylase OafA/YrhL